MLPRLGENLCTGRLTRITAIYIVGNESRRTYGRTRAAWKIEIVSFSWCGDFGKRAGRRARSDFTETLSSREREREIRHNVGRTTRYPVSGRETRLENSIPPSLRRSHFLGATWPDNGVRVTPIALCAPDIVRPLGSRLRYTLCTPRVSSSYVRKWRMSFQSTTIRLRRLTLPSARSLTSCARSFPRPPLSISPRPCPHVCNASNIRVSSAFHDADVKK